MYCFITEARSPIQYTSFMEHIPLLMCAYIRKIRSLRDSKNGCSLPLKQFFSSIENSSNTKVIFVKFMCKQSQRIQYSLFFAVHEYFIILPHVLLIIELITVCLLFALECETDLARINEILKLFTEKFLIILQNS